MNANVILTHSCNLRCKHCYMVDLLGDDDIHVVLNNIITLKRLLPSLRINKVNFTGGECTTSKYLLEMLQWSRSNGYSTSIFTNGIELSEIIAEKCDCLYLSVDGSHDVHNGIRGTSKAFDGILNAITIAKKCSLPIHFQTTINKDNIALLPQIIPVYESALGNLKSITLECAVNKGNAKKNGIILNQDDLLFVRRFKQEILEHFHYSLTVRDNIYTVRQIEQLVNSNSIFPFWIDLNEGLCYVLSPAFSFSPP